MKTRLLIALAGVLALAATGMADATPASQNDWTGDVYELIEGAGPGEPLIDFADPLPGSAASYRNTSTGVEVRLAGRKLTQGHAYTMWIMAFNHPEFCNGAVFNPTGDDLRCGQDDHLNPATGFSIMYATGGWATGTALDFHAFRPANSATRVPADVALGMGLVNPTGAEIHLRIRDHGPAQPGLEEDQISTFAGGCTQDSAPALFAPREGGAHGNYPCRDVHATAS